MAAAVTFIEVLDPTAKARMSETPLAPRLTSLQGKVGGFLENTKPNADVFQNRIKELLIAKYNLKAAVWVGKAGAALPLSNEDFEKLKACDFVINAWGD